MHSIEDLTCLPGYVASKAHVLAQRCAAIFHKRRSSFESKVDVTMIVRPYSIELHYCLLLTMFSLLNSLEPVYSLTMGSREDRSNQFVHYSL